MDICFKQINKHTGRVYLTEVSWIAKGDGNRWIPCFTESTCGESGQGGCPSGLPGPPEDIPTGAQKTKAPRYLSDLTARMPHDPAAGFSTNVRPQSYIKHKCPREEQVCSH